LGWTEAAMIGVQVQLDQLDSVVERIRELPEASYLFQAAGDYDLFVEVFCKDRDHFVSFLNDTLVKIPGIVRTQSFLILKMHKISYRWGEANSPRVNHTMQASQDPVLDKEK
jgi:Lrp/AsnC family transcriptional regulator for asnA, asnC and gidA